MAHGKAVTIVQSDKERLDLESRVRRRKSSHGVAGTHRPLESGPYWAALHLLASVKGPWAPLSVLFTNWLSMTPADGVASWPSASRAGGSEAWLKAVLETGIDLGSLLGKQGQVPKSSAPKGTEDDTAEAGDYQIDFEDLASQQIASLIKSEFAGHALEDLMAQIVQVKGYTTKVWSLGPVGGVDILAAVEGLGSGEDRICVQVKSGDGPDDHDVVVRQRGSVAGKGADEGSSGQHRGSYRRRPKRVGQRLLRVPALADA